MIDPLKYDHIKAKVEEILIILRPFLEADGGNMSFYDITDDFIVLLKLHGSCESCSMSVHTIRGGVEEALMKEIPEIKGVQSLT